MALHHQQLVPREEQRLLPVGREVGGRGALDWERGVGWRRCLVSQPASRREVRGVTRGTKVHGGTQVSKYL